MTRRHTLKKKIGLQIFIYFLLVCIFGSLILSGILDIDEFLLICAIIIAAAVCYSLLTYFSEKTGNVGFQRPLFRKDGYSRSEINAMNGIDFEYYCKRQLRRYGGFRHVEVTPASGDFGADIIAEDYLGNRWVFQCKRFHAKVSNSAIQEVVASKVHYNAQKAGVITNSSFTTGARQLAKENHVLLIEGKRFKKFMKY